MKFLTSVFSVLLTSALCVSAENSPEFTLQFYAPAINSLSNFNIILSDSIFSVKDVAQSVKGYIHENGTLFVDGYAVGKGRGYLTTTPQSKSWEVSSPWTISEGVLELEGDNEFFAVPEGTPGSYVLSAAKKAEVRGITKMNIKPVLSDGSIIQTWPKTSTSTSITSSNYQVDIRLVLAPIAALILVSMTVFSFIRLRHRRNQVSPKNEWQPVDEKALLDEDVEQGFATDEMKDSPIFQNE
ncbi:uncharacterized protein SAPINGB_P005654 [Magnusiomyces paraingens]|uniref:Uncharacterized protein n=1 Tax=Magnusiomyces paraingens TaxID=2606893 RepID=A0A5E8C5Z9_9ASCO|nr:uncharacterized protein SAPINGB_P005654 [Saprochaete ingens]VVT57298.1 unnamed protein product [Saprochaete ingens]